MQDPELSDSESLSDAERRRRYRRRRSTLAWRRSAPAYAVALYTSLLWGAAVEDMERGAVAGIAFYFLTLAVDGLRRRQVVSGTTVHARVEDPGGFWVTVTLQLLGSLLLLGGLLFV